jgi:hypothetical protein
MMASRGVQPKSSLVYRDILIDILLLIYMDIEVSICCRGRGCFIIRNLAFRSKVQ